MKADIFSYDGRSLQYYLWDIDNIDLKVSDITMPTFLAYLLAETMNGRYYGNAVVNYAKAYGLSKEAAELLVKRGPWYCKFFEKVMRRSIWKHLGERHLAKLIDDTD